MQEGYYQAPQSGPTQELTLMDQFSDSLAITKRWMTVFQVLFIIGIVLCFLAAAGMLVLGISTSQYETAGLSVVYFFAGAIYLIYVLPFVKARKMAADYIFRPSADQLGLFLAANARLWKIWGITTLAFIGLYLLLIVGLVVAGLGAAMFAGA
ncbi:MAG: hypothetical protein H6510_02095 [Acidobacteria bacterium]|nr:hypothetical protein [Acidobacteriota bacterium]MCB9396584.1 hypothetical protein [Acidobacteriota bacterium]